MRKKENYGVGAGAERVVMCVWILCFERYCTAGCLKKKAK